MKKCKSCGNSCPDEKNNCSSCGSNQFNVICNNCGTAFDEAYCPNCGVKRGDNGKECPVCNKKYFSAACPDCGYTPNKGNTVVINNGTTDNKKKGVTVWKVLLWIFFLPIMGSIAIWKSNMKKGVKIGLIVAIWVVMIISWIVSGNSNSSTTNTTNTSNNQTQTNQNQQIELESAVQSFVNAFNSKYKTPITDLQSFDVKDTENGHYKYDYRLDAFDNAKAYTGKIGDATIDIVYYGKSNKFLRIYVNSTDDTLLREVFKTSALIMEPNIKESDVDKVIAEKWDTGIVDVSGDFSIFTFTYNKSSNFMLDGVL